MKSRRLPLAKAVARAQVIKSLAHPTRVRMVDALAEGELCVCDLRDIVGLDLSTVSKHLTLLKAAGVVEVEKRGLNQFYRLKCHCLTEFFCCVDAITAEKSREYRAACRA